MSENWLVWGKTCMLGWVSDYISEGNATSIWERYLHFHNHCSVIHKSQAMKTICVSVHRCMDKETAVNLYKGILVSPEEEESPAICNHVCGVFLTASCVAAKDREKVSHLLGHRNWFRLGKKKELKQTSPPNWCLFRVLSPHA